MENVKRKSASMDVIEKRLKYLHEYYFNEVKFFSTLFMIACSSHLDCSINRRKKWWEYSNYKIPKDYNEIILTCLEVQKRIYNSINHNKLKDEDLIFIRWQACAINFDLKDSVYETIIKQYPNIKKTPQDYKKVVTYPGTIWENEDIKKSLSAKKNNLANYLKPFKFRNYKKLIDLLMKCCDINVREMDTSLIKDSVKNFLHDIEIKGKNELSYTKKKYFHSNDSFNAVFYSEQGKESYVLTWNRFYNNYPEEIETKFNKVVWKKTPKIKK